MPRPHINRMSGCLYVCKKHTHAPNSTNTLVVSPPTNNIHTYFVPPHQPIPSSELPNLRIDLLINSAVRHTGYPLFARSFVDACKHDKSACDRIGTYGWDWNCVIGLEREKGREGKGSRGRGRIYIRYTPWSIVLSIPPPDWPPPPPCWSPPLPPEMPFMASCSMLSIVSRGREVGRWEICDGGWCVDRKGWVVWGSFCGEICERERENGRKWSVVWNISRNEEGFRGVEVVTMRPWQGSRGFQVSRHYCGQKLQFGRCRHLTRSPRVVQLLSFVS